MPRSLVLHDEVVRSLRETAARIAAPAISGAFVAAARSRRLAHWSSLASFALARVLPVHAFEAAQGRARCRICGAPERVDYFESDHFAKLRAAGTVRSDSPHYALYDLRALEREPLVEPTAADRQFFAETVARVTNLRPGSKTFLAERAAGAVYDSRVDRKQFLAVLGVCGILDSPQHRGFWPAFVPYEDRARLDVRPYAYPVAFWRSDYGLNADAVRSFGSGFACLERLSEAQPAPSSAAAATNADGSAGTQRA